MSSISQPSFRSNRRRSITIGLSIWAYRLAALVVVGLLTRNLVHVLAAGVLGPGLPLVAAWLWLRRHNDLQTIKTMWVAGEAVMAGLAILLIMSAAT